MKKYVFKPYLQIFPELFQLEKKRIESFIKGFQIEHVGSTAVPNLGGKGIIDIAIAILPDESDDLIKKLELLGYSYHPKYNTPSRRFLKSVRPDPVEGERTYHLHLTDDNSLEWQNFLNFRDALIRDPIKLVEYEKIKQRALELSDEGESYREMKDPFFKAVLS